MIRHMKGGAETCTATLRNTGLHVQAGEGVLRYLACHPDVINAVLPLAAGAQRRARAGDTWSLELHRDPETGSEYLTLQLRRQAYDADTLEVVDTVGAIAERLLARTSGWILVTTDFQPPSDA